MGRERILVILWCKFAIILQVCYYYSMSNKQDPFKNNIIFLPGWKDTDKEGARSPHYENLLGSRAPGEKVQDTIKRVNNEQERIL